MTKKTLPMWIPVVLVVCAGAGWYAWRWTTPRRAAVDGTIVSFDPATRTGVLSFVHPKSGETLRLSGELPPECAILIGDQPCDVDALRAGDRVRAEGFFYRSGRVVATRVVVQPRDEQAQDVAGATTPPTGPPENGGG